MKALLVAVLLPLSVVALALPARADNQKDEKRMRQFAADYAACVVRHSHDKASKAVLSTSGNIEVMSHYSELVSPDCLEMSAGYGVDARFPASTMQAALSDALVKADFSTHGDASFENRLPLAQPVDETEAQKAEALAKAKPGKARDRVLQGIRKGEVFTWLARYGECVVRENPEGSRYWLLTPPDTPEETSRIKALMPAFSACLGPGTMKFNRGTARNTVAINYYRLAMATIVPVAGSKN